MLRIQKSRRRPPKDSSSDFHQNERTVENTSSFQGYQDRPRQEINMVVADANTYESNPSYDVSQHQSLIFIEDGSDTQLEEEDRRRREINMFAAFANPEYEDRTRNYGYDSPISDAGNLRENNMSVSHSNSDSKKSPGHLNASDTNGSLDLQQTSQYAVPKESSGTFVMSQYHNSSVHGSSDTSNKHLSAALASLTSERNSQEIQISSESSGSTTVQTLQISRRKPKITDPYIECVLAQRPLFFGNRIPHNAIEALIKESSTGFSKSKTYKFIRSAIEAFGHVPLESDGDLKKMDKSSYITFYEPVWGNEARLKREDRINAAYDAAKIRDQVVIIDVPHSVSTPQSDCINTSNANDNELGATSQQHNTFGTSAAIDESKTSRDLPSDLSENIFLKYARGVADGEALINAEGTLLAVPKTNIFHSDQNGSFEGNDMKKHVGINENLSKALESLSAASISLSTGEAGEAVSEALRGVTTISNEGRLMSNYEISQGRVPLYGCDDPSLPSLADLGKFETKEEQLSYNKKFESQDIISNSTVPNIFGSLICPSAASGPEDTQNWTSRGVNEHSNEFVRDDYVVAHNIPTASSHRYSRSSDSCNTASHIPSPLPPPPTKNLMMKHNQTHNIHENQSFDRSKQTRIGWWNSQLNKQKVQKRGKNKRSRSFGSDHSSFVSSRVSKRLDDYSSVIFPQPLEELNRSLSEMHPASESVKVLPLISDRSPRLRYIQIDTQVVGFPSIGEIEPFFCSLCLWHVEPKYNQDLGIIGPDIVRCGRITESLHFDVVNGSAVEELFKASLYSPPSYSESFSNDCGTTRCGIFPISSAFQTSQTHAVLIVHKVFGDESELDLYLGNDRSTESYEHCVRSQMNILNESNRPGRLITPFAFGVVPLVQIIGQSNPISISSRACQIPLFRFLAGGGSDQIVDHIIALTQPSASTKHADLTNGGKAMLIIRNFGYMGPHASLSTKSKLARDRLVDFTGETQVRLKDPIDQVAMKVDDDNGKIQVMKGWHEDFVVEPTLNGGRKNKGANNNFQSIDYCQELASVPLTPIQFQDPRQGYGEVELYTSFHNELMLLPHRLYHCSHSNITMKVEIVRIKKIESGQGYIVSSLKPCIHNTRRGPFLIDAAFTTVAHRKTNPSFMDDIKVKLPLEPLMDDINGQTVALFSVYHVSMNKNNLINMTGDDADDQLALFHIGCGFLPLSLDMDSCSLIPNGIYSIDIKYKEMYSAVTSGNEVARILQSNDVDFTGYDSVPSVAHNGDGHSDTTSPRKIGRTPHDDQVTENDSPSSFFQNFDVPGCVIDDMMAKSGFFRKYKTNEQKKVLFPVLEVRLVSLSSYHPQNNILSKFFRESPSIPILVNDVGKSNLLSELERDRLQELHRCVLEPRLEIDDQEVRLQNLLIDLSRSHLCPHVELTKHFFRTIQQLWRILVIGRGFPSLRFANPAMCTPLRLHSFSTILYVISSVSSFLSRAGPFDGIGLSEWDSTTICKIVTMLFDENAILLDEYEPIEDCRSLIKNDGSPRKESQSSGNEVEISFESQINGNTRAHASESDPSSSSLSTKDDIALKNPIEKPFSIRARSFSAPHVKQSKVDTKMEFQIALNASISPPNHSSPLNNVPFGPAASRRKWLGGSVSSLATIEENSDDIDATSDGKHSAPTNIVNLPLSESITDSVDSEIVIRGKSNAPQVKQMRVPQTTDADFDDSNSEESLQSSIKTIPNMDEIEAGCDTFLKIFEVGSPLRDKVGEERRVGISHHRKTKSRCSIDWTLPPADHLFETQRKIEALSGESSIDFKVTGIPFNFEEHHKCHFDVDDYNSCFKKPNISNLLPSYLDRLKHQQNFQTGRWFPYTYEVITFQWVSLLSEQSRKGPKESAMLAEIAQKSFGHTVSCAPVLFTVMKKSLGFRIDSLFRRQEKIWSQHYSESKFGANSLMRFDDNFTSALETLITMLTDACIDSRNFDSWSFRNTSFNVNDAIVRFLLDLFAVIDHRIVHRLVLTYFSRYVSKNGKQSQDRDSKIGLRCSWEVTKMRLNAVTTLVRFSDFIHINRPKIGTLGSWSLSRSSGHNRRHLFLDELDWLNSLEMSSFAASELHQKKYLEIPQFQPHWLSELVVDICLNATGHVEQSIQHRASSLLHELFWSSNLVGTVNDSPTTAATLYISFIPKLLNRVKYISSLQPKGQIRIDLLSCVVYVLQNASFGYLKALFGKLCIAAEGAGSAKQYSLPGFSIGTQLNEEMISNTKLEEEAEIYSVLDFCSLLNLSLSTLEYEGNDSQMQNINQRRVEQFRAEFILHPETDISVDLKSSSEGNLGSSTSRKWFSHDAAIVVINTCRTIVREYLIMQKQKQKQNLPNDPDVENSLISPAVELTSASDMDTYSNAYSIHYSLDDKILFIRAFSSVYLNCLSLRQSDIVISKTLVASIEIVKIFGMDLFLQAIGETLQHWMRLILFYCGARRSKVRVDSLEMLALMLRLQWDISGSFTRIRVPMLAVQTEVMEKIVAASAYKFYLHKKKGNDPINFLSTIEVEAALTPLWRTLHRLHHSSASKKAAFKSALQMLASRMKTLYKAYIAAHALVVQKSYAENSSNQSAFLDENLFLNLRVIIESAEFSKEIIGNNQAALRGESNVVHEEVIEDSLLAAANVFSPVELPFYRIAWLRKLAEFHNLRKKYAEEAACHLEIHKTLRQTLNIHDNLWNSSPFLPWATKFEIQSIMNDDVDIPLNQNENLDNEIDQRESSYLFRRILCRANDSMRNHTIDWNEGGSKTLFNGASYPLEYIPKRCSVPLREIENDMVREAELAGELFLKAGIIESSRHSWSLASIYYSEMHNYSRLAFCYKKLANVVASQIPTIDTSSQLETSSPLGRFYRVYYHGGASGNLMGREFVYRAATSMKLELFCKHLEKTLTSILPDKTPIELVLDDGRVHEHGKTKHQQKRQLGAVLREQMIVKVTPLKPFVIQDKCTRGSAEWFYRQTDLIDFSEVKRSRKMHSKSVQNNFTVPLNLGGTIFDRQPETHSNQAFRSLGYEKTDGAYESVVKRFSFAQPRDRSKCSRDLFKGIDVDVTEKSLRVTELLLSNSMPACVSRQPVSVENRSVFNQSPLEASVETVCGWCEVLFRTAIATNGASILGDKVEKGIGKAAVKVVAECIHQSRVKETGLVMLDSKVLEKLIGENKHFMYERLSPEEVKYYQTKLSRAIVMFMELLHILIGRNRDLLLLDSKTRSWDSYANQGGLQYSPGYYSDGNNDGSQFFHDHAFDDGSGTLNGESTDGTLGTIDRTDKAKALQRELQIAFVSMIRALYPVLLAQSHSETPRWMKFGSQDNYFSSGLYRQTRIVIGEELLFFGKTYENSIDIMDTSGVPTSILPSRSLSENDHESHSERSVISKSNSRNSLLEYQ